MGYTGDKGRVDGKNRVSVLSKWREWIRGRAGQEGVYGKGKRRSG